MVLRAFMTVDPGAEEQACMELMLLGFAGVARKGYVEFEAGPEDLVRIAYRSQVARRVLVALGDGPVREGVGDLRTRVRWDVLESLCPSEASFAVRCERQGLHEFRTLEVEEEVGSWVGGEFPSWSVRLDQPQVLIHLWVCEDACAVGVDVAGRDLSKREYRVFIGAHSLKGSLAAALLRFAGFERGKVLLDPFCGSGVIPIEAAFMDMGVSAQRFRKGFACSSLTGFGAWNRLLQEEDGRASDASHTITGFDPNLACISSAKKNAKIAGVVKAIVFSKVDAEWIDLKFEEGSVDVIATHPPQVSNNVSAARIDPVYNEFFHQARFVLRKDGVLALMTGQPDHVKVHAAAKGLVLVGEQKVFSGQMGLWMLRYRK
ncbi:MAG: methyltransferase [Nitrosarchaeum sp.]|nr:methyltransferase [Nitrosarchaeum sp.]